MFLTFFVMLALKNFRKEIQALYFIYFNESNQKTGLKLLGKRTVVLRNVEKLDMAGSQLKTIVNDLLSENNSKGRMFGSIVLPDYTKIYNLEIQNRRLEFFHELHRSQKLGYLSRLLLPNSVVSDSSYIKKRKNLAFKIKDGLDRCDNSGYAFACFSSFEAISTLQNSHIEYINK